MACVRTRRLGVYSEMGAAATSRISGTALGDLRSRGVGDLRSTRRPRYSGRSSSRRVLFGVEARGGLRACVRSTIVVHCVMDMSRTYDERSSMRDGWGVPAKVQEPSRTCPNREPKFWARKSDIRATACTHLHARLRLSLLRLPLHSPLLDTLRCSRRHVRRRHRFWCAPQQGARPSLFIKMICIRLALSGGLPRPK